MFLMFGLAVCLNLLFEVYDFGGFGVWQLEVVGHISLVRELCISHEFISNRSVKRFVSIICCFRHEMHRTLIGLCLLISSLRCEEPRTIRFELCWESACPLNQFSCIPRMLDIILACLHVVAGSDLELTSMSVGCCYGCVVGIRFAKTYNKINC